MAAIHHCVTNTIHFIYYIYVHRFYPDHNFNGWHFKGTQKDREVVNNNNNINISARAGTCHF